MMDAGSQSRRFVVRRAHQACRRLPAAQHLVAKQSDLALTWIKDADCTIDPAYQVAPCLSRSWPRE